MCAQVTDIPLYVFAFRIAGPAVAAVIRVFPDTVRPGLQIVRHPFDIAEFEAMGKAVVSP